MCHNSRIIIFIIIYHLPYQDESRTTHDMLCSSFAAESAFEEGASGNWGASQGSPTSLSPPSSWQPPACQATLIIPKWSTKPASPCTSSSFIASVVIWKLSLTYYTANIKLEKPPHDTWKHAGSTTTTPGENKPSGLDQHSRAQANSSVLQTAVRQLRVYWNSMRHHESSAYTRHKVSVIQVDLTNCYLKRRMKQSVKQSNVQLKNTQH